MRKRFAQGIAFDAHRGDIGAYYGSDNDQNVIQDFFNPNADRGSNPGDAQQRLVADVIYELPGLQDSPGLVRHTLGGIFTFRTGERLIITQTACPSMRARG